MDAEPVRMPAALSPLRPGPAVAGIADVRREFKRHPVAILQG
jgi:hypothetical protein